MEQLLNNSFTFFMFLEQCQIIPIDQTNNPTLSNLLKTTKATICKATDCIS